MLLGDEGEVVGEVPVNDGEDEHRIYQATKRVLIPPLRIYTKYIKENLFFLARKTILTWCLACASYMTWYVRGTA